MVEKMRNSEAESRWHSHPIIGYVALDKEGNPVRAQATRYGKIVKFPPRIYKTMNMALKQSPCESAVEVRMFQVIDGDN